MPSVNRVTPLGVPKHIIQRVIQRRNNRQVYFGNEQDMDVYVGWLKDYPKKYHVDVHAWVPVKWRVGWPCVCSLCQSYFPLTRVLLHCKFQ